MTISADPESMEHFEEIGRRMILALDATPRTNAQEIVTAYAVLLDGRREPMEVVPVAHARQLEKELNAANHALSEIRETWDELFPKAEFEKWSMAGTMSRFRHIFDKAKRLLPYYPG